MRKLVGPGMVLFIAMLLFSPCLTGQKKLLVIGSSTSTCSFGPSSFDNCYLTRLQKYYADRGLQVAIDNRAVAGDNCYHGAPTNYPVPPGRNGPRPFNNITEGLAGNPDVVLVNYPSNGYDEYSVDEVMACLRAIKQAANNAGKECYITTTQPRQDPESFRTSSTRAKMLELKNRIVGEFGTYAINFWDGIAHPNDQTILPEFNADNIHLNDNGHRVLFERVVEKNVFRFGTNPPPANQSQGLNYRYYQGEWVALPDFNSLGAVKSGTSANIDLSPRNADEYFSFLWEGFINIPAAGVYTFELVSDDGSKMYFNGTYSAGAAALVNNDGLHEQQSSAASVTVNAPGAYPVAFAYFQRGGGHTMEAYWSGPGFSRQRIPDNVFSRSGSAPPASGGLRYRYYEGQWVSLPDFNALGTVKSGSSANVDLAPANASEYFGFLWEGSIRIPVAGVYTFEIVSDDGSKMYFNSTYQHGANAFINNDGLHETQSSAASVNISSPGNYPVAFAYFQRGGGRTMQVYWTGPGFSRQLVPNEAFAPGTTPPPSSTGALRYRYFEGQWVSVPNFNALTPVKSGNAVNLDLSVRNANEYFGIVWEGFIRIPQAGNYNFEIASDDGSNLYFNTPYSAGASPLVNNDGLHEEQYINNNVYVGAPGNYPIAITYFQRGGGHTLKAFWSGPGFSRQPIPDAAFTGSTSSNATSLASTATTETIGGVGDHHVSVYPNPFTDKIRIMYRSSTRVSVATAAVYDMAGKLVYKKQFGNLIAGDNLLQLEPGSGLPGMYVVKLQVNNKTMKTVKLVRSAH